MKISIALKKLYDDSEVSSYQELASLADTNKGFLDRAFAGKNTLKTIDKISEVLTPDISEEEFLLAIRLIREIKSRQNFEIM